MGEEVFIFIYWKEKKKDKTGQTCKPKKKKINWKGSFSSATISYITKAKYVFIWLLQLSH